MQIQGQKLFTKWPSAFRFTKFHLKSCLAYCLRTLTASDRSQHGFQYHKKTISSSFLSAISIASFIQFLISEQCSYIYLFFTCKYNVQFRPYSTKPKSQMPIRIRSRRPFGVRCCQLTSEQQQTSGAEPGSTKCFVCGTTSGTTSERCPDARTTLQPCTAPQNLAAKLSSKRHHHLRLCWPNASFHSWKNEFLDLEKLFLELRWGLRRRPLPDLWGSAPERPSTISTGGSSQACATLYACGTMSGTTSKRRPAEDGKASMLTRVQSPGQICWSASWNVQGHQHGRKRPNYVWS